MSEATVREWVVLLFDADGGVEVQWDQRNGRLLTDVEAQVWAWEANEADAGSGNQSVAKRLV